MSESIGPINPGQMSTVRLPGAPGAATVELPGAQRQPVHRRGGVWRELSGALAVGMAALAIVVLVFQMLALARGMPGPGIGMVTGHLAGGAAAVLAQRYADRTGGWPAAAAAVAVTVITAAVLWLFWWA